MRRIDADKELKALDEMKVEGEIFTTAVSFAKLVLIHAPSVNGTSFWIPNGNYGYFCSACKYLAKAKTNFCPNCGADAQMRGKSNDDETE